MTPYNMAHGLFKARQADHTLVPDPGDGGTFKVSPTDLNVSEVVTVGAETRVLPDPDGYGSGTSIIVVLKVDGGDLTITDGAVTLKVLTEAGQGVEFIVVSVNDAGQKHWVSGLTLRNQKPDLGIVTIATGDPATDAFLNELVTALTESCIVQSEPVSFSNLLKSAANFGVLASSTVTNTGATTVTGDLGLSPGTSVTGFPPGVLVGTEHVADPTAEQAKIDAQFAYNYLQSLPFDSDQTGIDLDAAPIPPGVHKFDTSAGLTTQLELDAGGLDGQVWVFQIGSTLTTAAASSVVFINPGPNGGSDNIVLWQVGSSATLGTTTAFKGTIIAQASVTMNTGATMLAGRALALEGAVTLDANNINKDGIGT